MKLTRQERNAIRTLKRLETTWPQSLWLFSASGSLHVMKKDANGKIPMDGEGISPEFVVATLDIENDGGDW